MGGGRGEGGGGARRLIVAQQLKRIDERLLKITLVSIGLALAAGLFSGQVLTSACHDYQPVCAKGACDD
jgi:hypothetical protein